MKKQVVKNVKKDMNLDRALENLAKKLRPSADKRNLRGAPTKIGKSGCLL